MPRYLIQDKVGFFFRFVLFWVFFLMQSQGNKPGSLLSLSRILGFWYPRLPVVDGLVRELYKLLRLYQDL